MTPGPAGSQDATPARIRPEPTEPDQQTPPTLPTLPLDEWLRADDRAAILSHDHWGPFSAKTGVSIYRYAACTVACVLDHALAPNTDAGHFIDDAHRGDVPIINDLEKALQQLPRDQHPTRLIIGIAEPGGNVPDAWRHDIETALDHGIPVLSGQHDFLADDPSFSKSSLYTGTPLVDLRRPQGEPRVFSGALRTKTFAVVLTIGTDCRSGKMTTTLELHRAARRLGLRSAWVATGQTGLLLDADAGCPLDRLIIDFAAGEMERQVIAAGNKEPDIVWVEGQGALSHPAYSGVTAALVHGSLPDAFVMCHVAGRTTKSYTTDGPPLPIIPMRQEAGLAETMAAPVSGARVAAAAIAAPGLDERDYEAARRDAERQLGVPATDIVRDGPHAAEMLVQAIVQHLRSMGRMATSTKEHPSPGTAPAGHDTAGTGSN